MSTESDRFVSAVSRLVSRGRRTQPDVDASLTEVAHAALLLDQHPQGRELLAITGNALEQFAEKPDKGQPQCLAAYPGGKCKIRSRITQLIPRHKIYVEVFGGAASVLLAKDPVEVEIYNDLSPYLNALLKVIGDPALAARLQVLIFQELPRRDEMIRRFLQHRAALRAGHAAEKIEPDPVRRALVLLTGLHHFYSTVDSDEIHMASYSAKRRESARDTLTSLARGLPRIAGRMANVQIYRLDWRKLVNMVDRHAKQHKWRAKDILFYLDPPYDPATIHKDFNSLYGDPGNNFAREHLQEMVDWARRTGSLVMISSKIAEDGPIAELDADSRFVRHDLPTQTRTKRELIESVWCNFVLT